MCPYLAVSFTAIFCSLPHKCSQFCSLEHNYSKYLSPSSSMLILLGFSKGGLSSRRWPKHSLKKVSKGSILTSDCNRRFGPTDCVDLCDSYTQSYRDVQHNTAISAFLKHLRGHKQPAGHLTPGSTEYFILSEKRYHCMWFVRCSSLDVSPSFL